MSATPSAIFSSARLSPDAKRALAYLGEGVKPMSPLMSLMIAYVLINKEHIPTAPVDDVRAFFDSQVSLSVRKNLSKLNEVMVVDADDILEQAYRLFAYRCHLVFNPRPVIKLVEAKYGLESFFGITDFFDPETLELIRKNPDDNPTYTRYLNILFNELLDESRG